jgi:hypothetical protein
MARGKLWWGLVVLVPLLVAGSTSPVAPPDVGLLDRNRLVMHIGDLVVTEDDTIVENLELLGTLFIEADNVVVRNTWIYTSNFWTVLLSSGSALIENVEIGHPDFVGQRGLGGDNVTARGVNIHHVEDGIKLGSNSTYDRLWIHDLDSIAEGPHGDAVQADGDVSNATIRNSYLDSTGPLGLGNAAAQIESSLGPIDGIIIEDSYLNGGNYTIFNRDGGNGIPANIVIRNNRFGPNFRFGLLSTDGDIEEGGNTMAVDGSPVVLTEASVTGETVATTDASEVTATTAEASATTAATTEATTATSAAGPESTVVTNAAAPVTIIREIVPLWVWPLWVATIGLAVLAGSRLPRSRTTGRGDDDHRVISLKERREGLSRLRAGGDRKTDAD